MVNMGLNALPVNDSIRFTPLDHHSSWGEINQRIALMSVINQSEVRGYDTPARPSPQPERG